MIDVGVREVCVDSCERDEIAREAVFNVDATGVKRAPGLARSALRAEKAVRFDDKKAAAFDAVKALQLAGLRNAPEAKNSVEAGPFVFFVFAANEAAKVQAPLGDG